MAPGENEFDNPALGQIQWRDLEVHGSCLGEKLSKAIKFRDILVTHHCFSSGHTVGVQKS